MKELKATEYSEVAGGVGIGSCGSSSSSSCGGSTGSRGSNYQDRSWQTSNRGSGSQANNFGKGGGNFGSSGGCTGGARSQCRTSADGR